MKKSSEQPLHGSPVSDTAIKQPVMITMLMLLLLVAGLLSYSSLPVNLLPDFELGTISIQVVYGGAGSEVLADQVAKPIEDAVSTISGVKSVTSTSNENYTVIAVGLNDGVNTDQALQSVRENVAAIRSSLPDGISEPVYQKADLSMSPVVTLAITSRSGQDALAIRRQIEDMVLPQIQAVPGVGTATLSGGVERQVNVLLDLGRLQALGVMPSTVSSAIAAANTNLSLGSTMVGDQEYNLRSPSVFSTTADIATVGLGNGYTIGDVATVQDGTADVDAYTRFNGKDAFSLAIRKQSGTNTAAVATAALAALDRALVDYPDIEYHVVANQADQVRENVDGAIEEIVVAVLLAMLVVWIFFRNIRNTIITVIGLPLIIVASFMGLQLFGISLNIVSLLALSVSAGLVVDDAIVVRENIFRRLEQGDTPRVAASQGTAQVSFSVLAMTLTVIAVFLPAALTNGIVGTLFKAFGVTVAAAMAISLLEAFTLGPMLSSRFLKQQPAHPMHIKPGEEHLPDEAHQELGKMERAFERLTTWTLRRRGLTMLIVLAVLVLGIIGSIGIKSSFIPELNVEQIAMAFDMPSGTPLERTDAMARTVEQRLMADPDVESVLVNVGGNAGARHAEYAIRLHDGVQAVEAQERLRAQMADVPEAVFALASAQGSASTDLSSRALLLQIRTAGDTQSLLPVVQQLREAFKDVPNLTDVSSSYIPGAPELQYRLRQSAANDYGLSNQALAVTMRTLVDGNTAAAFREGGKSYDIVVRLRPEDRRSIDELQDVSLPLGSSMVPVRALADFQVASSASTVRRADRLTEVQIGGTNTGRVSSDVQADMQKRIDQIQLPPGVTVSFGGQISSLNDGFTSLFVALFLSVLLVYMVLASQFGSFTQPIVIMLAMPLSLIGAALGLRLAGEDFSILAFIGLLMLMGMVVKNSILLVDFTNKLREAGMEKHPALIRASAIRLRPILMTSLAVVLGNLPAVLGLGAGAEMRRGLAIVVAGGMIASTILALVVIPVAYSLMDSISLRASRLFHRAPKPAPQAAD